MKKTLTVMMMVIALAMSTMAVASPEEGADLVTICHVNEANGVVYGGAGNAIYLGRVIEVSYAALDAHLAHGDSTEDVHPTLGGLGSLITPTNDTVAGPYVGWQWESVMANAAAQDVPVVNANCAFRLGAS